MDVNQPGCGRGRGQIAAIFAQNGQLLDIPAVRGRGGGRPLAIAAGPGLPLDNLAGRGGGRGHQRANLAEPVQPRANFGAHGRGFPGRPRPRQRREQTTLECMQIYEEIDNDANRERVRIMNVGLGINSRHPFGMGRILPPVDSSDDDLENPEMKSGFGPARGIFGEEDKLSDAIICEIESPDLFYIQPRNRTALTALEQEMFQTYFVLRFRYNVYEHYAVLGGFYAVYTEMTGRWHRACVLSVVANERKPRYVAQLLDYGRHVIVKKKDIQSLRRSFLALPTQACVAKLFDTIKPRQTWTRQDIQKFKDDFLMKPAQFFIFYIYDEDITEHFRSVSVAILTDDFENPIYTLGGKLRIPI